MTENEKALSREIARLEMANDELKRKVKAANEANFKLYQQMMELSYYIRNMEKVYEGR